MVGYWDKECPVQTNHKNVKVAVYVKAKQTLVAIGNFGDEDQDVMLAFDWKALGLDPTKVIIEAPEVKDFQEAKPFQLNDVISVKSKQGWLLILREK